MKRKWEKPQLIAFVKSRPEEAVLAACKQYHTSGPGVKHDGPGGDYCSTPPFCNNPEVGS